MEHAKELMLMRITAHEEVRSVQSAWVRLIFSPCLLSYTTSDKKVNLKSLDFDQIKAQS